MPFREEKTYMNVSTVMLVRFNASLRHSLCDGRMWYAAPKHIQTPLFARIFFNVLQENEQNLTFASLRHSVRIYLFELSYMWSTHNMQFLIRFPCSQRALRRMYGAKKEREKPESERTKIAQISLKSQRSKKKSFFSNERSTRYPISTTLSLAANMYYTCEKKDRTNAENGKKRIREWRKKLNKI